MRIALGIPILQNVPGDAFCSHLSVAVEIGRVGEIVIISPTDMFPVDRARDFVWKQVLEKDCQYLLFVDYDTILPLGAFGTLLEALKRTGSRIATGKYLVKGFPYHNVWAIRREHNFFQVDSGEECFLDGCGMGCALIDVPWVREKVKPPYWVTSYDEGGLSTEDYPFCRKVRAAGGKIVGVPSVSCGHVGRIVVSELNAALLREVVARKEFESEQDGNLD